MIPAQTAPSEPRPGLAIGGGVLAGLVTLALVAGLVTLVSGATGADEPATTEDTSGMPVEVVDLAAGDCIDIQVIGGTPSRLTTANCDEPHQAEVTGKVPHPDADGPYPSANDLAGWLGDQCTEVTSEHIGVDVLDTVLDDEALLPDFNAWNAGDTGATCYVERADAGRLDGPVADAGDDYPRGERVAVSRLKPGDCFVPAGELGSYDLNSNSAVLLVDCDGEHNGIFFGRARLEFAIGSLFPGDVPVGDATSARCSQLFADFFDKPADGFNYRYWRPNQQSWEADDRTILCSVLDANPLTERFTPADFDRFFDLSVGTCFDLGPEETDRSLRLDDQVRIVRCAEPHLGQMIGSGELEQELTEPYPGKKEVEQLAGAECEQLFEDFVGTSPYESEFGDFPFWFPNEDGWGEGDRRFACAILSLEERTGSLEGDEPAP